MGPQTTLLTTAEVARKAERTVTTVLNHVKAGRLQYAMKLPTGTGAYLFEPDEVDRWLAGETEAAS
jgi:hypothetical protein